MLDIFSLSYLMSPEGFQSMLIIAAVIVAFIVVGGQLAPSPYGRFADKKMGISMAPNWGWCVMELPATLSFLFFFFQGQNAFEVVPLIFLAVWCMHYSNRGFIFPLLMRVAKGQKGSFGVMVIVSGWLVTALHGYLYAVFIGHLSEQFTTEWLTDPRFIIGMMIYLFGFTMNIHSDAIIRNLRSKEEVERGDKVYRIPRGGLFNYVSSPSYLTELLSFLGLAIATWNLGALFVLLVSAANLIPRAFQTHRWYKKKFPEEYPKDRKVLIPYIL